MKSIVFRISALATAIGVAIVVASGGRSCARGAEADGAAATATSAPAPAASVAAPSAANTNAPGYEEKGIVGPSTKADPHAIRRAVQGLAPGLASAPAPSTSARP